MKRVVSQVLLIYTELTGCPLVHNTLQMFLEAGFKDGDDSAFSDHQRKSIPFGMDRSARTELTGYSSH